MYAVIEADWLDELPKDVVSTDRTSIDWESEDTEELHKRGYDLVEQWINEYKQRNTEEEHKEIAYNIINNDKLPKITSVERNAIVDMVCNLGPQVKKDGELRNKITEQLASAMTHHPTRQLIKDIWDGIDNEMSDNIKFANTLEKLNEYSVPESLSLSVTTAQRIYAINKLYCLKTDGKEPQLQKLLEKFPWILSPDMAKLTANQQLKIAIKEGLEKGLIPAYGKVKKEIEDDGSLKPDFIFFSNADEKEIQIVELKSPRIDLINEHRAQLVAYIDYIEEHHTDAKVRGILIGRNPKNKFKASALSRLNFRVSRIFCMENIHTF